MLLSVAEGRHENSLLSFLLLQQFVKSSFLLPKSPGRSQLSVFLKVLFIQRTLGKITGLSELKCWVDIKSQSAEHLNLSFSCSR